MNPGRPKLFVVSPKKERVLTPRKRLKADERERRIADAAIQFFAENGFEGQTRELAKRIGITQPLLYRYFPSKEALIERVYQEVFVNRWNPLWNEWLADRSQPLEGRLVRFYQDYSQMILSYEWVRLFLFSGLRGLDINRRYVNLLRNRIFSRVITEIRHTYQQPPLDRIPMTETEVEIIWALHAGIFYLGVRRWIYGLSIPADLNRVIAEKVAVLLGGVAAMFTVMGRAEVAPLQRKRLDR
jgi:AcrR family transcriptional regulator